MLRYSGLSASVVTEEVTSVEVEDIVEDVPAGKDNAEMPEEQPIDEDWDKD